MQKIHSEIFRSEKLASTASESTEGKMKKYKRSYHAKKG